MTPIQLDHTFVEEIPQLLEPATCYVSIRYATAAHLCPCRCGHEVNTPISPTDWALTFDGETVSLHPSISKPTLPPPLPLLDQPEPHPMGDRTCVPTKPRHPANCRQLNPASQTPHPITRPLGHPTIPPPCGSALRGSRCSDVLMHRSAEGMGFEPMEALASHAFQACPFGRSGNPPRSRRHRAGTQRAPAPGQRVRTREGIVCGVSARFGV